MYVIDVVPAERCAPSGSAARRRRGGALAAALAAVMLTSACGGPQVNDAHTDVEVLAEFEDRIAESIESLPDFPGFERRVRTLRGCYYGMNDQHEDRDHLKADTVYELPETAWDDPLVREEYPARLAAAWEAAGYDVQTDIEEDGTGARVSAEAEDGVTVTYWALSTVGIEAYHSGCVPIDTDAPAVDSEPLGGVEEADDYFDDWSARGD